MYKDILYILLLIVVTPVAFVLMPLIGVIIGIGGLAMLIREMGHSQAHH